MCENPKILKCKRSGSRRGAQNLRANVGLTSRSPESARKCRARADVAVLDTDVIILATGAIPKKPILIATGSETIPVIDPWQAIADDPKGQHILINDEGGGRAAFSAADSSLTYNQLTSVIAEYAIGELATPTVRTPISRRILMGQSVMHPSQETHNISAKTVMLR